MPTHNLLRESFLNIIFQVLQMLKIILPQMAEGFSEQREAIFGFGPKATEQT